MTAKWQQMPSNLGVTGASIAQANQYVKLANRLLEVAVVKARQEGRTWKSIGDELGVTHQGARSRWAGITSKALASTNGGGAESANGVLGPSDHAGSEHTDSAAGPGDDRD